MSINDERNDEPEGKKKGLDNVLNGAKSIVKGVGDTGKAFVEGVKSGIEEAPAGIKQTAKTSTLVGAKMVNSGAKMVNGGTKVANGGAKIVKGALTNIKDGANIVITPVGKTVGKTTVAITDKVITKTVGATSDVLEKTGAAEALRNTKEKVDLKMDEISDKIREKALEIISEKLDIVVVKLLNSVKESVKDPDMPKSVMKAIDGVVDEAAPELKDLVMEVVSDKLLIKTQIDNETDPGLNCFAFMRAKILYIMFPYDVSIWRQLKNPWWWFFTIISVTPKWGISQMWWFLMLLVKDRGDEYQLVNFLIGFKFAQFISVGVISVYIGAISYIGCVHFDDHTCVDSGPGAGVEFLNVMVFYLGQIVMTWIAAAHIPGSTRKGGKLYKILSSGYDPNLNQALAKKGGRVMKWLILDLFFFLTCVILAAYAWYSANGGFYMSLDEGSEQFWFLKNKLYWLRVLYGISCFPWLIFRLPLMYTFILHLKPTAYNKYGTTVAIASGAEIQQKAIERLQNKNGGQKVAPMEAK